MRHTERPQIPRLVFPTWPVTLGRPTLPATSNIICTVIQVIPSSLDKPRVVAICLGICQRELCPWRNGASGFLRTAGIRRCGYPVRSPYRARMLSYAKKAAASLLSLPPKSLLATLAPLREDFPPIRDLPPDPVDL